MRTALIGAGLALAILAATAAAQSAMQGTVAAVDPAAGRFVLALDSGGRVTVQAVGRLPPGLAPGARVRVFGQPAAGNLFNASRIEPVVDPTGVRSRLQIRP